MRRGRKVETQEICSRFRCLVWLLRLSVQSLPSVRFAVLPLFHHQHHHLLLQPAAVEHLIRKSASTTSTRIVTPLTNERCGRIRMWRLHMYWLGRNTPTQPPRIYFIGTAGTRYIQKHHPRVLTQLFLSHWAVLFNPHAMQLRTYTHQWSCFSLDAGLGGGAPVAHLFCSAPRTKSSRPPFLKTSSQVSQF